METRIGAEMETPNVEQAAAWNGREGEQWAEHADRYERSSRRHWQQLLDADLISRTDAVLDIGCGTGRSTREAGRIASEGSVIGVDLSAPMLEQARRRARAEGVANVTFIQGDAQVFPFDECAFDTATSSFGAMFFGDPVAAFANIRRGLRPGGRLALLAWREIGRNEWLSEIRSALAVGRKLPEPPPDAPTPFSLADPDRVRRTLDTAEYDNVDFAPVDEPIEFGTDADDAYTFMQDIGIVQGLMQDLDDDARTRALSALRRTVDAHASDSGVLFGTSAWLITARRSG